MNAIFTRVVWVCHLYADVVVSIENGNPSLVCLGLALDRLLLCVLIDEMMSNSKLGGCQEANKRLREAKGLHCN
jgi:hypothetical protein